MSDILDDDDVLGALPVPGSVVDTINTEADPLPDVAIPAEVVDKIEVLDVVVSPASYEKFGGLRAGPAPHPRTGYIPGRA